jgi:L-arabinose isomerase
MIRLDENEVWFVVGSQHLYGPEVLRTVEKHGAEMALGIGQSKVIPVRIVFKGVVKTPDEITNVCEEANQSKKCIGVITWMHTFSPAKMWIAGLRTLRKPLCHLHTQYNKDLPWSEIDMDFMNLNQAAHGDREFGFIGSRLRLNRKIVVGFWKDEEVLAQLGGWMRAASAWFDAQGAKFARFGDNMREVAVTEGDKVEAQIQLGYSVNGYGVGDLVKAVNAVPDAKIDALLAEYEASYTMEASLKKNGDKRSELKEAARIELGMRAFLEEGGFKGFTTTFEDLNGLKQLPGLAVQRLMADGYGFGAEGDWKTAALVRAMKVMSVGMDGGTSFMEDYTYHFGDNGMKVLGAHMLEVCPSIADKQPALAIHPLSIGGKDDPARLIFTVRTGPAVNASLVNMGNRFRLIINEVDVVPPDAPLKKLPVASAVWIPRPNLKVAAGAWIMAGGAHHTGFSHSVTATHLEDFAEMAGIESVIIGKDTQLSAFRNELRWNDIYYSFGQGLAR